MSKLFSPIKIRDLEIRNRLWVSPMCMYSCENQDGIVGDWHLVHLGSRAIGGAGLVMAEATGVSPEGRISPWCPGIWDDEQIPGWQRITSFIKSTGATSAIQLAHAGRKGSTYRAWSGSGTVPIDQGGWESVSASAIAFEGYEPPRKLHNDELPQIVEEFVAAARRALTAGFEVIEIHAAHGYLMHQFLSPLSNNREDEYGGSLENRARLLLETVKAVRDAIGNTPLLVRFSATDYIDGGWDQMQTNQEAAWCYEAGADLFDISSGGLVAAAKIPVGPGYQVPLSASAHEGTGAPTSAVGLITTAQQAEEIVSAGDVEVVMMGRQLLRDPYFPLRAAHELKAEVSWPVQYERGRWPSA